MENENPEYVVTKEEEDEYLDKIKYLGKDMSKALERYQKELWLKTITWYIIADNIKDKIRDFIEKKVMALDITIIILAFSSIEIFLFKPLKLFRLEIISSLLNHVNWNPPYLV